MLPLALFAGDDKLNGADTAWMLVATAFVMLMTPAGLALFYGGLTRNKNVLNTMGMSLIAFAVGTLVWVVAGYSIAFGKGDIIGTGKIFLNGITESGWEPNDDTKLLVPRIVLSNISAIVTKPKPPANANTIARNSIAGRFGFIGVVGTTFGFNVAATAGRKMVKAYLDEVYDEVYVIYSEFISMGRQIPTVKQLLPIPPIEKLEASSEDESGPYLAEHICEPSAKDLLGELLPRSVFVALFSALLETSTSEHAARMAAMDNATSACNDMIETLTLAYNKARQASITAELMDIVGGAEALKG